MARGYQIVDPGLAATEIKWDFDAQARCLSYLLQRIREVIAVSSDILFELIPVQYTGPPYPCIGLYTETFLEGDDELCWMAFDMQEESSGNAQLKVSDARHEKLFPVGTVQSDRLCLLSFDIEEELHALVTRIGLEQLLKLSSSEEICWRDILDRENSE